MTDTKKDFLGIPVSGDIQRGDKRVDQRPLEELAPPMQAVLDDPTIVAFGWSQYTPYFNDGDPCVFSVHGVWIQTTEDRQEDSEDYAEEDVDYWRRNYLDAAYGHPTLGERKFHYAEGPWPRERIEDGYTGPDEARYDRCHALSTAINSGAFDNVLLENFGDHAEITVTKTEILVDECSHD